MMSGGYGGNQGTEEDHEERMLRTWMYLQALMSAGEAPGPGREWQEVSTSWGQEKLFSWLLHTPRGSTLNVVVQISAVSLFSSV
jgi:hypothetical protein